MDEEEVQSDEREVKGGEEGDNNQDSGGQYDVKWVIH